MATIDRRGVSVDATDTIVAGDPNPGLAIKAPCRVATTGNIVLSGLQTVDGVALAAGDRIMVWQQSDPTTNGLYNVSTGLWTRTIDAGSNDRWTNGMLVEINGGATYARDIFQCQTADPILLGTTAIVFQPGTFLAAGQYDGAARRRRGARRGSYALDQPERHHLWADPAGRSFQPDR
jgi:hypothetical protein